MEGGKRMKARIVFKSIFVFVLVVSGRTRPRVIDQVHVLVAVVGDTLQPHTHRIGTRRPADTARGTSGGGTRTQSFEIGPRSTVGHPRRGNFGNTHGSDLLVVTQHRVVARVGIGGHRADRKLHTHLLHIGQVPGGGLQHTLVVSGGFFKTGIGNLIGSCGKSELETSHQARQGSGNRTRDKILHSISIS